MPNLIKHWVENFDQFREASKSKIPFHPPHLNPVPVSTHGMDQVNTAGSNPKPHPQPFRSEILEELGELKRKLTGRPHGVELEEKERQQIEEKIAELEAKLAESPDDADATYGLRYVPITNDPSKADLKPTDINKE